MSHPGKAFAAIIAIGFATACAMLGWYPAAFVVAPGDIGGGAHIVWASDASRMAESAIRYYGQAAGQATSTMRLPPELAREARSKSVDALIDAILVRDAIVHENSGTEADAMIEEKMATYVRNPEFSVAVSVVYGLDTARFVGFVARPEIEREFLKGKRGWDDAAFTAWLASEREKSKIVRFAK